MKKMTLSIAVLGAIVTFGCNSNESHQPYGRTEATTVCTKLKMATVKAVDNAVIRQHTIYPHHFTMDSAELNDLGLRDITILARHFLDHPGKLNVRRAKASDELYMARVSAVKAALSEAGVSTENVRIADGLPGGDGIDSASVLLILESESGAATSEQLSIE